MDKLARIALNDAIEDVKHSSHMVGFYTALRTVARFEYEKVEYTEEIAKWTDRLTRSEARIARMLNETDKGA